MRVRQSVRRVWGASWVLLSLAVVGCASPPESVVSGPLYVPPVSTPNYVERVATGSLFQPNMPAAFLFTGQQAPRRVGDTLKVDISEAISASSKLTTDTPGLKTMHTPRDKPSGMSPCWTVSTALTGTPATM